MKNSISLMNGDIEVGNNASANTHRGDIKAGFCSSARTDKGKVDVGSNSVAMGTEIVLNGKNSVGLVLDLNGEPLKIIHTCRDDIPIMKYKESLLRDEIESLKEENEKLREKLKKLEQ